jgi:urease gamma subunit
VQFTLREFDKHITHMLAEIAQWRKVAATTVNY